MLCGSHILVRLGNFESTAVNRSTYCVRAEKWRRREVLGSRWKVRQTADWYRPLCDLPRADLPVVGLALHVGMHVGMLL